MRYRSLDINGDFVLGGTLDNFLTDVYALAQALKTKLMLFQAEWWENQAEGLPMFQSIIGGSGNQKSNVDLLYQKRILEVVNIKKIESFNSSLVNRVYSFYCTVSTSFGVLNIVNVPASPEESIYITTSDGTLLTTKDGSLLIAG